ncbi:MAG: selenocysteine-specific translation elongation factor [Phycisphaerales bacterium]|nr:selenocysteine-specific translation elongation factor [Phycisphaerales bacterium]
MRHAIVGTAGHIDHGKTALVRALTGIECDRLPQEQARGMTIDIGFASMRSGDVRLGIVDVPGHERFVRNMLAGASGFDAALLVVACDDGVMPQTREHLVILELLEIERGVVALTKCDLADAERRARVEDDVRDLLRPTFLREAPMVCVSSITGEGVEDLRAALVESARAVREVEEDRPFRLAVDRAFVLDGVGTVVTGTVASGVASVGDALEHLPEGRAVRVRSIQAHGARAERVGRGQRAALHLAGVHHTEIRRGHELATPGSLRPTRLLTVRLRALDDGRAIRHRERVRVHLGAAQVVGAVHLLEGTEVAPGDEGLAQLVLAEAVVARGGQAFVVRAESPIATLGGGIVLHPVCARIPRRDVDRIGHVRRLRDGDASSGAFLFGIGAWSSRALDLVPGAAAHVVPLGAHVLHPAHVERLETQVLAALHDLHARTGRARVERTRLRQALDWLDGALLDSVLDRLLASGRVSADGATLTHPEMATPLPDEDRALASALLDAVHSRGFEAPDRDVLASEVGVRAGEVARVLRLLVDRGDLVHIGGGLHLEARVESDLRDRIVAGIGEGLTMSDLRVLIGTSRKYAVPIGEYLDRIGLTKRRGDRRVLA